jgi:hypothetical protein
MLARWAGQPRRRCEERSDEAIHGAAAVSLTMDCFASLAMTMRLDAFIG